MSGVQPDRVAEKAAYVRAELAFLRTLSPDIDPDSDPAAVRAARYSLQTSVSALTDIAYHLCAKQLQYAPENARDAFRRLRGAGAISEALLSAVTAMVGFRNLAAHGYEVFDDEQLRQTLRHRLGEVEAVLAALEAFAGRPAP